MMNTSIPIITFFNNKGGVGKTTLVYHLAHMYAHLGLRVLAADLDPQANLTAFALDEEAIKGLLKPSANQALTIAQSLRPLMTRLGDFTPLEPYLVNRDDKLAFICGDLELSAFESSLSDVWPRVLTADEGALRVTSAMWRLMQDVGQKHQADLILVDIGPNLGAINRAALISSDYIVVPLRPDLFSVQGLRNLGPTLKRWREDWQENALKRYRPSATLKALSLPQGHMTPLGYVILQHLERLDRPVQAYQDWLGRIPLVYHEQVLGENKDGEKKVVDTSHDPYLLGFLRNYQSLMVRAQEANKPLFALKPADGALGSHTYTVQEASKTFKDLAQTIAQRIHLALPH